MVLADTRFLAGILRLSAPTYENALRAFALMRRYADAPMDFADASLVVTAEVLNISRILTFDRHFYVYRINDKTSFEVLP
jgi:predicted nucleic acid-binding protein